MRSPVAWTLLGLVIERPGYGYQLLKRFEREYGDVLPLSSESHVYTALNALRDRGLIEALPTAEVVDPDAERQPRPRYRATRTGVQGYQNWLRAQVLEDRRQARLFARQLAVFARDPVVALEIIGCLEQAFLQEARQARLVSREDAHSGGSGLAGELVSEESRLVSQAKLVWAEYARGRFEVLRQRESHGDGPVA
jgi:DNA-binding PadR family transcriptional regulator